jgi:hypothetical protein
MDRPALQRLLADMAAGHIDCVIVNKVDRLGEQALADAARLRPWRQPEARSRPPAGPTGTAPTGRRQTTGR